MGLRFEAWTLPTAASFQRKFHMPDVLAEATGVRELSAWTDAAIPLPASWGRFDDLIAVDDASLIRVFDEGEVIDEMIAQRCPFSTDRPAVRLVSGPGINGIVEKCGVYAFADRVDDWIWGSEVNILTNPGFEENTVTPTEWELSISATGGTYTLTDGTSTTDPIAFDAQAGTIATRIQDDIAAIDDVIVTGTSVDPYNRTITLVTPAFGVSLAINTGSLTGGSGTLTVTEEGGEEPAGWSNARSLTLPPSTHNYDAFEVSTDQARSGTRSLLIDPGTIQVLANRAPGCQQVVRVHPGQTYRAGCWIYPTSDTDRFRLGLFTVGDELVAWTSGSGTTLTPNQWNQLTLEMTIPTDVDMVVLRTAVTNSGVYEPSAAYYDDFDLIEGMPAATMQAILDQLLTAAQDRGTFAFLEIDAETDKDSNGVSLDPVAFAAWYGQDLGHVLNGLHALGYNWRIVPADQALAITPGGQTTHVLQIFDIGTVPVDHTASAGAPSVIAGSAGPAELVRRVPEFTAIRARGLSDIVVDDTNATALANMGRWEKIVDAENIPSEAALQMLIDAAFASEDLNQSAVTATLTDSDPARPLARFDAGDRIWWQLPGILTKEARPAKRIAWSYGTPTTYTVQGSKILSGDAGIAQAVDYLLRQFQRRRRGEGGLRASDIAALAPASVGAHIHLEMLGGQTVAAGPGDAVKWTRLNATHPPAEFAIPAFPASSVVVQRDGYYDIGVELGWDTHRGGGAVSVVRTRVGVAETVWPALAAPHGLWTADRGRLFSDVAKGVDCQPGDELSVVVAHDEGSGVDLVSAALSVELVDRIRDFVPLSLVTLVQARWWADGASEPSSWHIEHEIDPFDGEEVLVGPVAATTNGGRVWDWIGAATGAGVAPMPGEGGGWFTDFCEAEHTVGQPPVGWSHWAGTEGLLKVESVGLSTSPCGRMLRDPTGSGGELITWDAPSLISGAVDVAAAVATQHDNDAVSFGVADPTHGLRVTISPNTNTFSLSRVPRSNPTPGGVEALASVSQSFSADTLYRARLRLTTQAAT